PPEEVDGRPNVAARERTSRGRRETPSAVAADGHPFLVEDAELAQVLVRLLEVITEDRLELHRALAVGVDAVGPAHEAHVEPGAGTLQQAVVDRVAHQLVVEAIERLLLQRAREADELLA